MKETIKQIWQTEWFLVKLMFETDTKRGIVYWLIVGTNYSITLISVWLWKLILDELIVIYQTKTSDGSVWIYLGIYLSLQVLSSILSRIKSVLYEKIIRKSTCLLDKAIMEKMSKIDTEFFDDPKNHDSLNAAQTSESYIVENIPWAVDTIMRIITFIAGLIMFLSYDLIVGVIYIATYIPGAIVSYRHELKVDQWSIYNIPQTREKNYYKGLLTGSCVAKDLRLYNLTNHFKSKYNELWNKIRAERKKLFVKGAFRAFLASLLTYSGIVVIIILSVRSVMLGTMAIGTFALYVGLAQSSGENFGNLVEGLACQIEIDVPHVIQYMKFLQYENVIKDNGTKKISSCPEIEFRIVYFKYPGNEEYTLNNLNFRIKSGKKIALIGVNGAGKTTIIKLLFRFYKPESGQILINDNDICEYSLEELHRIFGVCFQGINQYSLTLKENIAISDIERVNDQNAVHDSAVASGADKIAESLSDSYETDMTRQFNDKGAELSGGQWQKVALSRAFFRKSEIIILDEPSSALDPEAEDYIFSSFKRSCQNKGGILISHRLSSIMMVDEIVLIDKGCVIENGSHEDLIKKNGKYAELYRMQAEKYVGGGDHE